MRFKLDYWNVLGKNETTYLFLRYKGKTSIKRKVIRMTPIYAIYTENLPSDKPNFLTNSKSDAEKYLEDSKIRNTREGERWTSRQVSTFRTAWYKTNELGFTVDVYNISTLEVEGQTVAEIESNKKLKEFEDENNFLKKENSELKCLPGGPLYMEALADWNYRNSLIGKEKNPSVEKSNHDSSDERVPREDVQLSLTEL